MEEKAKVEEKKCKYCSMMIPKSAKVCPHCRKKQGVSILEVICLLIFGLFVIGYIGSNSGSNNIGGTSAPTPVSPKQEAMANVKLDYNWFISGFGSVMEADFTIKNNSKYTIKDIEIKCTHAAPSGTVIDSNTRVIYETVEPGKTKKIRKFNMGFIHSQVKKSGCVVTDLVAY